MIALGTAATRFRRRFILAAALAAAPLLLGSAAWAQGNPAGNQSALRFIKAIAINGTAGAPLVQLQSFDISWVDTTPIPGHPSGLYYLADRSNAALAVVDIATETLFGQIGGSAVGF